MSIDFDKILRCLSCHRKVFRSEEDFQHEIVKEIHRTQNIDVCTEYSHPKFTGNKRLDIWLPSKKIALELKYKTRSLILREGGEFLRLKDQRAQDQGRYKYLADVERLEHLQLNERISEGYAILLTNDHIYWNQPTIEGIDADFKLHDTDEPLDPSGRSSKRILTGVLQWGPEAGAGSTSDHEKEIHLKGKYVLDWKPYSEISDDDGKKHRFRYLMLRVNP